jgi:hypothetical protein
MSLKLALYFESMGTKSRPQVALLETRFWRHDSNRKLVLIAVASRGNNLTDSFRWSRGVRVFCSIFLRSFSLERPLDYHVERAYAQTMHDVLRFDSVRNEPEMPSWIQIIFGYPAGKIVPLSLLDHHGNHSAKKFEFKLGREWEDSVFEVYVDANKVGRGAYAEIAARLECPPNEEVEKQQPVTIIIPRAIEELSIEEVIKFMEKALAAAGISVVTLRGGRESSTAITIELSSSEADRLEELFANVAFDSIGTVEIQSTPATEPRPWSAQLFQCKPAVINLESEGARGEMRAFLKREFFYESFRRHWRRLGALLTPRIEGSPIAAVVGAFNDRCYCELPTNKKWKSFRVDLMGTLILWPLLTASLILVGCLLLETVDVPVNIMAGLLTGLLIGIVGAQPCSALIGPPACGAGGIGIGAAFGLAHAILLGRKSLASLVHHDAVLRDPFTAISGGLAGMTAGHWKELLPITVIIALLMMTGAGIGLSGWLMGQPARVSQFSSIVRRHDAWGLLIGAVVGSSQGVVLLLTTLLGMAGLPATLAFMTAFSLVGGAFFALAVRERIRRQGRNGMIQSCLASLILIVVSWALFSSVFNASDWWLPIALSMACGWYQAVWFTSAFVFAHAYCGRARGAVWATWIEGVGGYIIFLLVMVIKG